MTRNILDYQGNVIGQLTLPDDTSAVAWYNALSAYAQPPMSLQQIIAKKLVQYETTADSILSTIKATNTLAGITPSQSAQMFTDFGDVLQMVREGAFPTAIYALGLKSPSGFVTQDMINSWIQLLQNNL